MEYGSYEAKLALIIADKTCAVFSIIGSSFIARDICNRKKRTSENLPTTASLLFAIALADICYSFFAHFLGSWLTPKDVEGAYPLAAGNQATCIVQGYLAILFVAASSALRCTLAVAFWLTVCREKQESELRTRKMKFLLFGFPWAFGLGYAAMSTYVVKPSDFAMSWQYCMAVFGPPGGIGWTLWGVAGLLYGITCVALVSFCMISLIRHVYLTERRMDRFSPVGDRNRSKTEAATRQGLLYIIALQFLLVPIMVYTFLVVLLDHKISNWAWILTACMKTLPGFLNSFIYFHFKYIALRKQDGLSPIHAAAQVLDLTVPNRISATLSSIAKFVRCGGSAENHLQGSVADDGSGTQTKSKADSVTHSNSRSREDIISCPQLESEAAPNVEEPNDLNI